MNHPIQSWPAKASAPFGSDLAFPEIMMRNSITQRLLPLKAQPQEPRYRWIHPKRIPRTQRYLSKPSF
jgi:hypothetical protein